MNDIPLLTEGRAHRLAYLSTVLTARWVSKLTALDVDAAERLLRESGFAEGCSALELVKICCTRAIPLPPAFLRGLDELQAANAAADSWASELIAHLRHQGLHDAVVDYAAFRRLTTFDADDEHPHTGHRGLYAYRENADGEKVGIVTGPAMRDMELGELGAISGGHQRDSRIDLPITAELLVLWVKRQAGEVQLNPSDPAIWVGCVAGIHSHYGSVAGAPAGGTTIGALQREKSGIRDDAMSLEIKAMEFWTMSPAQVMAALIIRAGQKGSCVVSAAPRTVFWRATDGAEYSLDLEALRKRLKRLRGASSPRR